MNTQKKLLSLLARLLFFTACGKEDPHDDKFALRMDQFIRDNLSTFHSWNGKHPHLSPEPVNNPNEYFKLRLPPYSKWPLSTDNVNKLMVKMNGTSDVNRIVTRESKITDENPVIPV